MLEKNLYHLSREDEFPVNGYIVNELGYQLPISKINISSENKFDDNTVEILKSFGFKIIWSKVYYKTDLTPGHQYAMEYRTYDPNNSAKTKSIIICIVSMYGSDPWYDPDHDEEFEGFGKSFRELDEAEEERKISDVSFSASDNNSIDFIDKIIKKIAEPAKKKKAGHMYLVVQGRSGLDTEPFKIACPEVNLEYNYGKKFFESYETIFESLNNHNNDKNGRLLLLHGLPGTGKTTFINYLVNKLNRKVLWLPTILAESMTSPGFLSLLIENKGCVLVIEDAERVIGDRSSMSSSSVGVSNILNLTDGALGDTLKVHVIATFNTKKENIDSALLRSGRLIACHEFGKLSVDDSNRLLKHLGKDHVAEEEMILSDIYSVGGSGTIINNAKEEGKRIGFGS